jgi:hypothetical protein
MFNIHVSSIYGQRHMANRAFGCGFYIRWSNYVMSSRFKCKIAQAYTVLIADAGHHLWLSVISLYHHRLIVRGGHSIDLYFPDFDKIKLNLFSRFRGFSSYFVPYLCPELVAIS